MAFPTNSDISPMGCVGSALWNPVERGQNPSGRVGGPAPAARCGRHGLISLVAVRPAPPAALAEAWSTRPGGTVLRGRRAACADPRGFRGAATRPGIEAPAGYGASLSGFQRSIIGHIWRDVASGDNSSGFSLVRRDSSGWASSARRDDCAPLAGCRQRRLSVSFLMATEVPSGVMLPRCADGYTSLAEVSGKRRRPRIAVRSGAPGRIFGMLTYGNGRCAPRRFPCRRPRRSHRPRPGCRSRPACRRPCGT